MKTCEQCKRPIQGFHITWAYESGDKHFCNPKCDRLYHNSRVKRRDLKADLELCKCSTPGPWNVQSFMTNRARRYEIFDVQGECVGTLVDNQDNAEFITQAREGWPHAIERALELEEELTRCGNTLVELTIALKDDRKRADKAETLARELVDVLGRVTPRYLAGRLELDLDLVHEANGLLEKAKEVLGDE